MLRFRGPRALAVLFLCAGLAAAPAARADGTPGRYVAGGTTVVRDQNGTVVDNGAVVCDSGDGIGSGGVCLPFGGGNAVRVVDDERGENVPFQVCIDNNGDGFCAFDDPDPDCPDYIAFSHDDDGSFANPVGPLPTGFTTSCPGGAWNGYVVFLCQGMHDDGTPHTHEATTGEAYVTSGGEGSGSFCGQPLNSKPYHVTGGGNYTCGMYAQDDPAPDAEEDMLFGNLYGGPWRHAGAYVVLRCEVYLDTYVVRMEQRAGQDAAYVETSPGVIPAPPGTVTLCTKVSLDGGPYEIVDVDWSSPGTQCALAHDVGEDETRVVSVPQTVMP